MHLEGNPSKKGGKRNVWCKHYSPCLDYAIENSWKDWGCGKCKHLSIQHAGIDVVSTNGDAMDQFEIPDTIYKSLF